MKSEDFERLKAVCEKEGFDVELSSPWDQTYRISKKDIWEGVDFAECINDYLLTNSIQIGKIYKRRESDIKNCIGSTSFSGLISKDHFKPSTESAYIEQLKAECFKRFGEIKDGDRFKIDYLEWQVNGNKVDFHYFKESDSFVVNNMIIYQQGKWATRVPERVKVDPDSAISITDAINQCFRKDSKDFGKFLAQKLEEYLNGESK